MDVVTHDLVGLVDIEEGALAAASCDAELARALIEGIRWPEGLTCPGCGRGDPKRMRDKRSEGQQKWRCSYFACDKQFNWRLGTPFKGVHSGPELILAALLEIRRGRTSAATIEHLIRSRGIAKVRAQHLVLVMLELSVTALARREESASFQLKGREAELRSLKREMALGRWVARGRGWVSSLAACTACMLIGGIDASQALIGEPDVKEKIAKWMHRDEPFRWAVERAEGEGYVAFLRRYNDVVEELKIIYPPD